MRSAVARAFASSCGTRRIGVELEMHVRGGQPALTAELAERARPTYEPGGQLEFGLAPQASVEALVREVDWCLRELSATTEVALTGTNPWRSVDQLPLQLATPRYLAMQELFDRTGPEGRQMMRMTASLQVCVDLLPGEAGREQWLVANLAGPSLVATYTGSRQRTDIWLAMDAERTAYDGRHLDVADPIGAYTAFAAAATRLPIPEAADDDYHLHTLFPPVRPRGGYLEIRYLDAQPVTSELLSTIWTLMYDEEARRNALELLLPGLPHYRDSWNAVDPADLLEIASVEGRWAA